MNLILGRIFVIFLILNLANCNEEGSSSTSQFNPDALDKLELELNQLMFDEDDLKHHKSTIGTSNSESSEAPQTITTPEETTITTTESPAPVKKLTPSDTSMKPHAYNNDDSSKCVDDDILTYCQTGYDSQGWPHRYPWLAIHFDKEVSVTRVEVVNRKGHGFHRTRNMEVRVANILPTDSKSKFMSGNILTSFLGPAEEGEVIDLVGEAEEATKGKFVILQMDLEGLEGSEWFLNLAEVSVYGHE